MVVTNAGFVGISTTTPKARLTVAGSGAFTSTLSGAGLQIIGNSYFLGNVGIGKSGTPNTKLEVVGTMSGKSLQVTGTGASPLIYADASNGRVGIGTASPTSILTINGTTTMGDITFPNDNGFNIGDAAHRVQDITMKGTIKVPTISGNNGSVIINGASLITLQTNTANTNIFQGGLNVDTIIKPYSSAFKISLAPSGGNVGVGTGTVKARLTVFGSGAFTGILSGSALNIQGVNSYILGNTGIGTGTNLYAKHTIYTSDAFNNPALLINTDETTGTQDVFKVISDVASANDPAFRIRADGSVFSDNAYSGAGGGLRRVFQDRRHGPAARRGRLYRRHAGELCSPLP